MESTMTAAAMIRVETVLQLPRSEGGASVGQARDAADAAAGSGPMLLRQQHRVAAGTTIRQLLLETELAEIASRVDDGALGLAVYGKRAWLDDILVDGSRVEVVAPIEADAKAARVARVAADRDRRRSRVSSAR
jgi:putative ubiquitin-RnfH superfamily antitoxin RatB of RatAB toxin-antitoxin module